MGKLIIIYISTLTLFIGILFQSSICQKDDVKSMDSESNLTTLNASLTSNNATECRNSSIDGNETVSDDKQLTDNLTTPLSLVNDTDDGMLTNATDTSDDNTTNTTGTSDDNTTNTTGTSDDNTTNTNRTNDDDTTKAFNKVVNITSDSNDTSSLNATGLETFDIPHNVIGLNSTVDDIVNIDDLVDDKNVSKNTTDSELGNLTSSISVDDNTTEILNRDDTNDTIRQPFITSSKQPNVDFAPPPPADKREPPVKPIDNTPDSTKTTFTDIGDGGFTDIGTNFDDGFSDLFAGDGLGGDTGFYDGDLCIEPPCDPLPTTTGLPTIPPTPAPPPPPPPPPPPQNFFDSLLPDFMPIPDNVPNVLKPLHDKKQITQNLKRRIESLRGQFDAFKTKPAEAKASSGLNFFNPFTLFSEVTGRKPHRYPEHPVLHPPKNVNNQKNVFQKFPSSTPDLTMDRTNLNRDTIPESPNNSDFQGFGRTIEKPIETNPLQGLSRQKPNVERSMPLENNSGRIPTKIALDKKQPDINLSDWPYRPKDPATRSKLDNFINPEQNDQPQVPSRQPVESWLDKAIISGQPVAMKNTGSSNTDKILPITENTDNSGKMVQRKQFQPGVPAHDNSDLSSTIFGSSSFPDSSRRTKTPDSDQSMLNNNIEISPDGFGSSLPRTRQRPNNQLSPLELFDSNPSSRDSTFGTGKSIPISRNSVSQNSPFTGLESTALFDPNAPTVDSSVPVFGAQSDPDAFKKPNNVDTKQIIDPVNQRSFGSESPFKPGVPSFSNSPSLFDDILFNRKPMDQRNEMIASSDHGNVSPTTNPNIAFSTKSQDLSFKTRHSPTELSNADSSTAQPAFKQTSNQMSIRKPGIPMWGSSNFQNKNIKIFNKPIGNQQNSFDFGNPRLEKNDQLVFSNDFGLTIVDNKSPQNSAQDASIPGNTNADVQAQPQENKPSLDREINVNSSPSRSQDSFVVANQGFSPSQPMFGNTFPKSTNENKVDSNQPMFGNAFSKPTKDSSLESNQPMFGNTIQNSISDRSLDSSQSTFGQSISPQEVKKSTAFGSSILPPDPDPLVPPPTDSNSHIDLPPPPPPTNMKVDQTSMLGVLFGGKNVDETGINPKRSTDPNLKDATNANDQNQAFRLRTKTVNDNLQNPPIETYPGATNENNFATNADMIQPSPPTSMTSILESDAETTTQSSIIRQANVPSHQTPRVSSAVRRELSNPAEICRHCHFINGYCYLEEPGNCARFIECSQQGREVRAFEKECPYNLFWHQGNLTCQISYDVHCKTDPCRNLSVINHPYIGKCRAYWTCKKGASHARCCPKGYGYGERLGKMECVPMATCNDECVSTTPDNEIKHECFLTKDPATPFKYVDINLQKSLPCAPGTRFDERECTCIQSKIDSAPLPKACAKDLFLDFEGSQQEQFNDKSGKGSTIETADVVAGYAAGLTAATFNKNGRIKLWKYANLKIGPAIAIEFQFFPYRGTSKMQTLLSNCNKQNQMASIEIQLDTWYSNVIFKIETSGKPHNRINEIKIRYKPFHWNHAVLLYTEGSFAAAVGDTSEFKFLEGQIPNRHPAIVIGGCSKNSPDGFIGYMDDISIYNGCIPMELESKYLFR